jgi:uncharacterized membrane protein YdjX (TVP38/TMEM64 family)
VLSVWGFGRPVILVLIHLGVAIFGSPWNWSCSVSGLLAKEFLFFHSQRTLGSKSALAPDFSFTAPDLCSEFFSLLLGALRALP